MVAANTPEYLEFRVTLLERSLTDAMARIGELTEAVGGLAKLAPGGQQQTPSSIEIDADGVAPFAGGFYRREEDSEGRPFRWTGRTDFFEIRIPADRNFEWAFTLEVKSNAHVNASSLRAYVDYAEVPVEVEAGKYVRGTLPRRPFSGMATLTFYLPVKFVPSAVDPKVKDARTLGLIFYGLRLEPNIGATIAADPKPALAAAK